MFKKMLVGLAALASFTQAEDIAGAGASFPNPVYQKWTYEYTQLGGDKVNYQSQGSGAGLRAIKAGTVDFAGSDNPVLAADQEKDGLIQFPMLTGGLVLIVNIPGVSDGELKLSRQVLADIYLGKIKRWNDKAITSINPGVKLPPINITVVRRSDSSGTSFIFTNYLSKISNEWKTKVGQGGSVKWPGKTVGGHKNSGVCTAVSSTRGAIGYTEYTYAVEGKLATTQLENASGKYLKASPASFSASAASADWSKAEGMVMELTNVAGDNAWPITGVTYVLIRKDTPAAKRAAMKKYFMWCLSETGADIAGKLHYVPLPASVIKQVEPKM